MSAAGEPLALPPLPAGTEGAAVPRWDLERLVRRACPACGADVASPWCRRPDALVVSRCAGCGMFYVADHPDAASLAAFYAGYEEAHPHLTAGASPSWLGRRLWWTHPLVLILERSVGLRGRSLAELGCSTGGFLERARARGARVGGVEIDEGALARLRALGIPAARRLDPGEPQDVVCAFQVLEHLPAPAEAIAGIAAALVDDGAFLLAVPNGGEGERVGPTWVGFRRDLEHLNYFSLAVLTGLLARHGLLVEAAWEEGQAQRGVGPRPGVLARLAAAARPLWTVSAATPFPAGGRHNLVVLARRAPRAPP